MNTEEATGFAKLNFYLDRHPEEDIFSKGAIDMTIEGMHDIEKRGVMAVLAASNKVIQEKVTDKEVILDVLKQGLQLVRQIGFVLGVMSIIKTSNTLKVQVATLQIFVSEKILEIIDAEENLYKLMRSIIHLYKLEDKDFKS